MQPHPIAWRAPEPLWRLAGGSALRAPAILRYTTDDFMQELRDTLATDPHRLGEYRAMKETWRGTLSKPVLPSPKALFALPFQRLAATRLRVNGAAPAGQGKRPTPVEQLNQAPTKLYQPAHQRYYLATSCLVCQVGGFPDRKVDPGKQEQAGFVMRRLFAKPGVDQNAPFDETNWNDDWDEYAWVSDAGANSWKLADESTAVVSGEEILPMFGLNYLQDDQRQRRLFAGMIPAGKREAYLAGVKASSAASGGTDITARKILLRTKVIEPWKQLVRRAAKAWIAAHNQDGSEKNSGTQDAIKSARIELQEASYFILADLAHFLEEQLNPVWNALTNQGPDPVIPQQAAALAALRSIQLDVSSTLPSSPPGRTLQSAWQALITNGQVVKTKLVDALVALTAAVEKNLENAKNAYDPTKADQYPPFAFPLADPEDSLPTSLLIRAASPRPFSFSPENPDETDELDSEQATAEDRPDVTPNVVPRENILDQLAVVLSRALRTIPAGAQPAIPLAAKAPADAFQGFFVIRCVYRRPGCGPLHSDVVSEPSEPFQLAGFFDPDAPARPIRIGLPIDTSPAGMRKFDKNTAFVLSDMLCGHVKRAKGMTFGDLVLSVLPFPFHQDLSGSNAPCKSNLGTICSLSIPIITICAFILLIIMVSLLDLIFHWMPFFMLCFPTKGLDGKKS